MCQMADVIRKLFAHLLQLNDVCKSMLHVLHYLTALVLLQLVSFIP